MTGSLILLCCLVQVGTADGEVARIAQRLETLVANTRDLDGDVIVETSLVWEEGRILIFKESQKGAGIMTETRRVACSDLVKLRVQQDGDTWFLIVSYRPGNRSKDAYTFEGGGAALPKAFRLGAYTEARVNEIRDLLSALQGHCKAP